MAQLKFAQDSNRIEIYFADRCIWIEVAGVNLPQISDASFALWFVMPIAMAEGLSIEVCAPCDPVALQNARKLAHIWSMWMPQKYQNIEVIGENPTVPAAPGSPASKLLFCSGGVDSTYMLLQPGVAPPGSHTITLHGFDYKIEDEHAFRRLLDKTEPIVRRIGAPRIVLKSNLGSIVRDHALTHGFYLAGSAFVFRQLFGSAEIAADFTIEQEMLAFPWGTSHVTNPLFKGTGFELVTKNGETDRIDKIAFLARDDEACRCLAFCTNSKRKPDNCGRCAKCVRTKAMFLLGRPSVPPIFNCNGFDWRHTRSLKLNERSEFAFCSQLVMRAREHGVAGRLVDIPDRYEKAVHRLRRKHARSWISKIMRESRRPLARFYDAVLWSRD